ncbi:hypothetical protein HHL16_06595 [Pseudoflavitalea sp. G-6-1-2]|uniref:hypothetical protein n=1 Tax=Pseudoflavitalea sp. G-6-1-2 TaxID=2728841 RepID=UPI00146EA6A8|nr:hypothetical protein [Pseudoflavitalea sp. G-6-1-2]NML20534.1 hypothetical protein [Pseudoflavitalea sp. G-6-1-2]
MKHWKQLMAAMLAVLLFASCDKIWDVIHGGGGGTDKNFRLKEFTRDARVYNFYYDKLGYVDSVVARDPGSFPYTYRVSHRGKYIDSSSLWQNGKLLSSRKNVQYNNKGQIKSYDYQLYVYYSPTTHYTHQYNDAGDLHVRTKSNEFGFHETDTFNYYPNKIGLKEWISRSNSSRSQKSFSNDTLLNPLAAIHGIEVIFVEESFDEYWNNKRNSISDFVNNPPYGTITNYVNDYDSKNRLIRKIQRGPTDKILFTFKYY